MSRSKLCGGVAAVVVVVALALCGGRAGAVDKPKPKRLDDAQSIKSALRFANAYNTAWQAGKAARAIEEGWDFESIMSDVFGKELKKQTAAETAETRARLVALVKSGIDKPDIAAALAVGQFQDYVAKADDDGHVKVTFAFVAGDAKVPSTLTLAPRGTSWRVVDSEINGTDVVMDVRAGYRKVAETVTPVKFMRLATAKLEEEMKAKGK